jgi:hypothetical protein
MTTDNYCTGCVPCPGSACRCDCHGYVAPGTVTLTPDYDNLRAWMLRVWADPTQVAFRGAILADPATLAWLNPPPPAPYRPSRPMRLPR